jgi:branched-chain amino acid transport system ATP-binding protein
MIKVENLYVKYGGITAVRDVSFEVEEGKIIALIGNNGAGKTSTLKTISGLVKPDKGRIYFEGNDITGMKPHEIVKKGIVHIPEGRHIFPNLTVKENLIMSSSSRNVTKSRFHEEMNKALFIASAITYIASYAYGDHESTFLLYFASNFFTNSWAASLGSDSWK